MFACRFLSLLVFFVLPTLPLPMVISVMAHVPTM